ncbi:type ISP restriction/modification enzyme [Sphingopyxis fribergensis]
MDIAGYLNEIRGLAASGQATEHSYRPALERLFASIDRDVSVINEPRRLTDVGAPDFVFNRKGVSIGWCEAKDLHKEITKFKTGDYSKEQKARYVKGLPNLIYTNGTDFEFIRKGEVTGFVSIADLIPTLPARPDQFARLEMLLKDFTSQTPISINTAKQLAEMMAGKAAIIKDIMGNALTADIKAGIATELTDQYEGFKISLIHDISVADFADIYAETIAYGLFAARLHDTKSLDTFDRAEALELLPKSNPFLRNLFVYIAGPNLDERLRRMIDDLCEVFRASDVGALMQDFGKFTARTDPFIHFYETFLAEYNPTKRKARGVWYTPEPVVNFIVRAVDEVLKTEFGLPMGLADTSKINIDWDSGQNHPKTGKPIIGKKEVHRVQILDPATGTGTFLAEAIKQIASQVKGVAEGMWSQYVEKDLIPRLHGFELLMASYAMCHMKLDMILTEMGYKPSAAPPRLGVYLTNSLEEGERVEQTLPFARWLSEEAKGANTIKRDTPIMCVIGNPPYSVSSSNKSPWIEGLMADYKRDLNEKNIQPLSDDYVKFLRLAQHYVEKNGKGIVGFITNNSYVDGVIHRRMRAELARNFDKIIVVDLHGSANKGETSPDGSIDSNVFDIMQGVAIVLLIKTGSKTTEFASLQKADLYGDRNRKYEALWGGFEQGIQINEMEIVKPYNLFFPFGHEFNEYDRSGFVIGDLMTVNLSGVVSGSDKRFVRFNGEEGEIPAERIQRLLYRPLDHRFIDYDVKALQRARIEIMQHMIVGDNVALVAPRQAYEGGGATVTDCVTGHKTFSAYNRNYVFPLYLYPEEGTLETERRVNFDPKIYAEIRRKAGLSGADGDELKIFDYIYGVLHSPDYRQTYVQFLKIDFPRIPYPASPAVFAHVAEKGEQLRRLHLMEDSAIGATPYSFKGNGDNVVVKPAFELPPDVSTSLDTSRVGHVLINPDQYFENVPRIAWEFHIGGYQPAQKWLKDRKGRTLSFDDVMQYQKIIKILIETDRIMKEIELPLG